MRGRGTIDLSGEDPRFYKRGIDQYPARLSGGLQSPTEINAQLHNAPLEHCYACLGTADRSLTVRKVLRTMRGAARTPGSS